MLKLLYTKLKVKEKKKKKNLNQNRDLVQETNRSKKIKKIVDLVKLVVELKRTVKLIQKREVERR